MGFDSMTYREDESAVVGMVVPELRMRMEADAVETGGEYTKLRGCEVEERFNFGGEEEKEEEEEEEEEEEGEEQEEGRSGFCCSCCSCWRWRGSESGSGPGSGVWYWIKLVLLSLFLGLLAFVFLKWVVPFLMDKGIIPIINWETTTFTTPQLAVLLFASVAIFPTFLLPSSPSMWVAGMTFGYGFGFLLIISAAAVGVSLPYFIGSLFLHKIKGWLEQYPKKAAILRAAGEGNCFHQFRAVTLIRISPFPYIIYNYCAVATDVKYGPYILGSLVGMVPETFVAIYTGILIRTLADASHRRRTLSAPEIIFTVAGFCMTVATTVICTVYAKKRLRVLQDEPLLA